MAEETTTGELAEIRRELGEIKSILKEIHAAVITDHQKLEQLEATAANDHEKLKELEATKRSLELTGRVNVRPPGL